MENKVFSVIAFFFITVTFLEEAECAEANDFCRANLTALGGLPHAIEIPSGSSAVFSHDREIIALCPPDNILLKCNDSKSFTFTEGSQGTANVSCASDYKLKRQKIDGGEEELRSLPPCSGATAFFSSRPVTLRWSSSIFQLGGNVIFCEELVRACMIKFT